METETIHLTSLICDSLNTICFKIFSSIDNTVYSNLDSILFINSDMINNNKFQQFLGTDCNSGLLLLANSLILGILIFYILHFTVSHLIYSKIDSPYQFLFKSVIFITCMYSSLWICEGLIHLFSMITDYIREIGYSITGSEITFSNLINTIHSNLYPSIENFTIFSFDGILKMCVTIGMIYILLSYSVRYILIKILILISPFAFISLVCNRFDGFFKGWLKQLLCLLFMQIFVAIVIVLGFCLDFSASDILSKLLYFAIITIIAKCHYNVKEIFAHIFEFSHNQLKNII